MKKEVILVLVFSIVFLVSILYSVHADGELARVSEAGTAKCAFNCYEDLQRCAPGCPCYYTKSDGTCGTREKANQYLESEGSEYRVVGPEYEEACK